MTSPAAEEDRLLNWVIELFGTPSPAADEPAGYVDAGARVAWEESGSDPRG